MTTTRERSGSILGRIAFYPPLFALVFITNLWVETAVSPFAAARSMAIAMAIAIGAELVGWIVTRSADRAGFVGLAVVTVAVGARSPFFLALLVMLVVAFGLWRMTGRRLPPLWRITTALNLFSLILFAIVLSKTLSGGRLEQIARDLDQGGPLPTAAGSTADPTLPDIYFVLLDGYPGPGFLERQYDDDNGAFLDGLRDRGFDVVEESRSNYTATQLTLPSMFNMRYLDQIDQIKRVMDGAVERQPAIRTAVAENDVFRLLRERGYQTIYGNAGFEDLAMRDADVYLDDGELNEFEIIVSRLTLAQPIIEALAPSFVGDQQRARVISGLRHAVAAAQAPFDKPRVAFIHVPSPHAPVAFGPHGEPQPVVFSRLYEYVIDTPEQRADIARRYHEQLGYLNGLVTGMVDDLIAAIGDRPSVVVLFSDHGSLTNLDPDPAMDRVDRVSDLIAVRAPDKPGLVQDGSTLVNLWPLILNAYLDADLPLAPDRSFVSFGTQPFDFTEVPRP